MAKIYLVRHAKASASFDEAEDPGLSDEGRENAVDMALRLEPLGPLPLISSPLKRAQETAAPLANRWGMVAEISSAVSEIPTPAEVKEQGLAARGAWLKSIAGQRWGALSGSLRAWRQGVIGTLTSSRQDCVIVTHFMVINAAIGSALDDDRVVLAQPDYCSVTVLESVGGRLSLVTRGFEAPTRVL